MGCACAELVFDWKKVIADRFFGGLLMADAALVSVFFKLAKNTCTEFDENAARIARGNGSVIRADYHFQWMIIANVRLSIW